jgi:monoamine oxidase
VTNINYEDDDNVLVSYMQNGVMKYAKAPSTLVTVSLGVLKAGTIDFTPSLPAEKQKAIDSLGYGTLSKCIMYWEDPDSVVWPKHKEWITLATLDEDRSGIWTSFLNAYKVKGVPVLVGFIGGDEAVAMEEKTNEEILGIAMSNLLAMFPTITRPDKFLITRWSEEEVFRGSYSFAAVDQGNFAADAKILGKRIGNLWFAGEATNFEGWHATTIGAWNTGHDAESIWHQL